MFGFVFRKMLSKKWMIISLLIGNLLMVAIAAANPMYSNAVLQRTLTQRLAAYQQEKSAHAGAIYLRASVSDTGGASVVSFDNLKALENSFAQMVDTLDVKQLSMSTYYRRGATRTKPVELAAGQTAEITLDLVSYSKVGDHVTIVHGDMFTGELNDNVIEVIVNEKTYNERNLVIGQDLACVTIVDREAKPYKLRVVGVYKNANGDDPYWRNSPDTWSDYCLMDQDLFQKMFIDDDKDRKNIDLELYSVLDYTDMRSYKVPAMVETLEDFRRSFDGYGARIVTVNFRDILDDFIPESTKLTATITVLQAPILVMLMAFVFMVSRQMLEMEQNEIAVFKSRGAAKRQIIGLYFLQSLIVAVMCFAGGIPLGVLVCTMLGASNAFLEFVQRSALPIELSETVWIYGGIAALFSMCTMVLPVFKFANIGIVDHKRQKNRKLKQPWWQLVFLDVVLLVLSLYSLNQYKGQEEYLAQQVMDGASMDPVLFLSSSVFMLGCGLLVLRLLPLLIRIVFLIGKRWWSPALYASFLRILRTKANQGFLVVFLVLTVAMGIFNTQTARTINANAEEMIRYNIGADVVLQERWGQTDPGSPVKEPDYGKYALLREMGAEQYTKVLVDKSAHANVGNNQKTNRTTLMGIHTKEFGQVAWFKNDLLSPHWYKYLNAMAQNSSAILVSTNFRDDYGYRLGDTLTFTNGSNNETSGIIYGFVDYWPSFAPISLVEKKDGTVEEQKNYLIVANLGQLEASCGVEPYQIWINAKESTQFVYEFVAKQGVVITAFQDSAAEIIAQKNDPIYQGTNGILTIGFIIVLVLCATGFLIYWILSIQSRTMQFGIFRAMGMSMREILGMLCNEQVFISGVSIAAGVVVGRLGSTLFVPLIQIAYSAADRVIPLEIISQSGDFVRLGVVIGLMIAVCMVALGVLISKIRISQALKLGED